MKVCIGGTFDILHKGHKKLLEKAFEEAGKNGFVFIGLVTGDLTKKKGNIKSFDDRKIKLEEYFLNKRWKDKSLILPITKKFGLAVDEDYDAIVVSPETFKTAEEINNKRIKKSKKPLKIIKVPFVIADDGFPISSSRIRKKEIDENGKLLKSGD